MNTNDFTENRFLKLIDNIDQRGTSQSDGVPFSPFRPFEDLSMKERAAVIRIGVQNGLRDLESIRSKYNEYADGGILFGEGGDEKSVMLAESRENDVNWIDNWLHSRIPQMTNNLDPYYNPTYEDVSKKGLGYSDDMKKINATNLHSLLPPMTYPMLSIGAKYPQIYKYIPFAENYRQDAAKRVIDSQVNALRNNTNVVDLRDPNVFATLNDNDTYALDFLKRHNKNGTLTANGATYGAGSLDGTNTIVISPFTNNKDVFLHEAVHSATHHYPIQNSAILKIFSDNKDNMYQPGVLYDDKMKNYLKAPTEVYSRLMEFRRHNNLDPSYKVTKEDLNRWRKDAAVDNKKLLDVFSDDVLLQLFNNVAHNNTLQDFREQFANQAAYGGPIVKTANKHLYDEGGETNEEYYPIWLDGITVKPSGNRPTTRDDWNWANWREKQNEREVQAAENVRRAIDRNGTPIAAGIYGLMAAPFAVESLGSSAIANGVRTGLNAMNTAFTPSTWLNPVTGAKLLSPTVGTIADAGIQGAFAYEGLNGLWNQGKQGTLLSDPANTFIHSMEVLPLVGFGSKAIGMGVDAWNNSGMKALWDISRADAPARVESNLTPNVLEYTPRLNTRAGLNLLERNPSRISEAERAGVPKGDRGIIRHSEPSLPYVDYSLINKHYEPWPLDDTGHFVLQSPEKSKRLSTIHFSFNSPVTAHIGGSWNDAPTVMLLPYRNVRSQAAPVDMAIYDTFFPNYNGMKISSKGAKALTGDMPTFNYYKSKGIDVEFSPEIELLLKELKAAKSEYEKLPLEKQGALVGEYPEVDAMRNKIDEIGDNIDKISRDWTIKHRKPIPNYEKVNELGKAEGYNTEQYPFQFATPIKRNRFGQKLLNNEGLDYNWVSDPSNHASMLQDPEWILKEYGDELRPQYRQYLKWLTNHKADYRALGGPLVGMAMGGRLKHKNKKNKGS